MDATAEWRVETDAPVPHLVAESLHEKGAVIRHGAGCGRLVVQLSNPAPIFREVHRIKATVGDGAWIGDSQTLRAGASAHFSGHAIPDQTRAQLDELIGWIPAAEHVEYRLERARPEVAVRISAADHAAQRFDVPFAERAHGDDLLRQNLERPPRHHGRLDAALEHALDDCRRLEKVATKLGDHHP